MTASRNRSTPAWLAALPCAAALCGWPQVSEAAEYLTAVAGGGGGTAFNLRCQDDQVLAGITGQAGAVVDRVQLLCVQIDPLGRWVGTEYAASVAGGTGGTAFKLVCARNHAVSGIQGRAGSLIDQLRIRCGPLTAGPRLSSIGSILAGQAGGSGGNAFGPLDCVDGKPGRGLTGRAASVVDQLRLACDYPPKPLRPFSAFFRYSSAEFGYIVRTPRGATATIGMSSKPRGEFRIPASSNNPSVAAFAGAEVIHSFDPALAGVSTGGVGCANLTVGFPGDSLRALTVLVEKSGGTALTLSPSIMEWSTTTTGAFGTLTVSTAAPAGGIPVALTSSHPTTASVPASVTIPAGSRSTTFEIRRNSTMGACVVLTANGNGAQAQSPVLFHTPPLKIR